MPLKRLSKVWKTHLKDTELVRSLTLRKPEKPKVELPLRPATPPPKLPPWVILITGGAGHLALKLVDQIEEDARILIYKEMDEAIKKELKAEEERTDTEDPLETRNAAILTRIEREVEEKLRGKVHIVLVDVARPARPMRSYISFIMGSFTDMEKMQSALINVNTVFHLAAVGMTGNVARNRQACLDINAQGTMNLLGWAREAGVRRFIYTSSIGTIFGGKPLNEIRERDVIPLNNYYNYYCESKAIAEGIVLKGTSETMKTSVLRFNGIYGPGEKRLTERVVDFMRTGLWLTVISHPNGVEPQTQLSAVPNCVQALIKADLSLRLPDSKHGRVYNIMDRRHVGTFSVWTPLNRALGFRDPFIPFPGRILRIFAYICEYISHSFNVDPFVSLLEVDLLLVNNTYSIDRAVREFNYEPVEDTMDQIIEMYTQTVDTPEWQNYLFRHRGVSDWAQRWSFIARWFWLFAQLFILVAFLYFLFLYVCEYYYSGLLVYDMAHRYWE